MQWDYTRRRNTECTYVIERNGIKRGKGCSVYVGCEGREI